MKKLLLFWGALLSWCVLIHAQEFYSSDVVYLSGDDNIITVRSSGIHEKKKQAMEMAVKSAFYTLFGTGIEGYRNGKPLVTNDNQYYMEQFYKGRYMVFVKGFEPQGDPEKLPTKQYKATATVHILANSLLNDLIRNKLAQKPIDRISMEETQEEIILPTIMVVPYKTQGQTYASILQNDFDRRMAVGKVQDGFNKKGVTTIELEGKLNATNRALEFESDNADSNDRQLLQNSGTDVYVTVDLQKDMSASGSRVSLSMKAYETASGNILASKQGWTNRFRTNSLDQLCVYAVDDLLEPFLKDISTNFARKIQTGNSVVLRFSIAGSSYKSLDDPAGSKNYPLADMLRLWVRKNAKNGKYHLQGVVGEEMIFDNVQIPNKDESGTVMDVGDFAFAVWEYLNSENISCSKRIDGNSIYITITD